MVRLAITLLGPPTVTIDAAPIHIGRRKSIALLAYLAVTQRRIHRASLVRFLWPDYDNNAGRTELRRAPATLTKALGSQWLTADRDTIGLVATSDSWVDVVAFREFLHAAATAAGPRELDLLEQTVRLAQADFLAGFTVTGAPEFEQWQLAETEQLRRELALALGQLTERLAATGDLAAALDGARRWLALDPLHEAAHRRIMELHAASGDPKAALRQYRACVRTLKQGLDASPEAETTALYERIRTGVHDDLLSLPPRVSLPMRQSPSTAPPHNLTRLHKPFIGRRHELAELAALLADPDQRLITLTGPGGVGKTWLATQAAQLEMETHRERWVNGLFAVNLTAVEEGELLAAAILNALPIARQGEAPPHRQLVDYLRPQQLLLVLDNLEQLLSAAHLGAVADLLDTILTQAPGVKLLVTARQRLNLYGETVFNLLGLPFPAAGDEHTGSYDAVKLFVQNARRSDRSFALCEENWAQVARICQLTQGMPLAITLAASWVRLLSCHEIATEIERTIDFLVAEAHNLPARHRSLRAIFDHSWRLLSDEEQQALCRLSVFRGPFTRQTAAEVAAVTLPALAGLVDKSLLHTNGHAALRRRYHFHEQVRQYAYERLCAAGEAKAAHQCHLGFFVALAEEAAPGLEGPQQSEWLDRLQSESVELHAAMQWALTAASDQGLRLGVALWRFWVMRGYLGEGRRWLASLLATARDVGLPLRAKTLGVLGSLAYYAGDFHAATQWLEPAVTLWQSLGDPQGLAESRLRLATAQQELEDFAAAQTLYEEAAAGYRALGNDSGLHACLNGLATLAYDTGDMTKADLLFCECLALARRRDDKEAIAIGLLNLSWAAVLRGDVVNAANYCKEALQRLHELDHRYGLLFALEGVAGVAAVQSDASRSIRLFAAAAALRQQFHMPRSPSNEAYQTRMMQPARTQLTDDAFADLWRAGSELSLAEAVSEAMRHLCFFNKPVV